MTSTVKVDEDRDWKEQIWKEQTIDCHTLWAVCDRLLVASLNHGIQMPLPALANSLALASIASAKHSVSSRAVLLRDRLETDLVFRLL